MDFRLGLDELFVFPLSLLLFKHQLLSFILMLGDKLTLAMFLLFQAFLQVLRFILGFLQLLRIITVLLRISLNHLTFGSMHHSSLTSLRFSFLLTLHSQCLFIFWDLLHLNRVVSGGLLSPGRRFVLIIVTKLALSNVLLTHSQLILVIVVVLFLLVLN